MKLLILLLFITSLLGCSSEKSKCSYDMDCPKDKVCRNGACVGLYENIDSGNDAGIADKDIDFFSDTAGDIRDIEESEDKAELLDAPVIIADAYFEDNSDGDSVVLVLTQDKDQMDLEEKRVVSFLQDNNYSYQLADSRTIKDIGINSYRILYFRTGSEPVSYNSSDVLSLIRKAIEDGSSLIVEYYGSYIVEYLGWGKVTLWNWYPAVNDALAYVRPIDSHRIFMGLTVWDPPEPPDKVEQYILILQNAGKYDCVSLIFNDPGSIQFWGLYLTYGWNGRQSTDSQYCQEWGGCTPERAVHNFNISYIQYGLGKVISTNNIGVGASCNSPVILGNLGILLLRNIIDWASEY